jgi:imidazolonepropionase-like amidohydrolase
MKNKLINGMLASVGLAALFATSTLAADTPPQRSPAYEQFGYASTYKPYPGVATLVRNVTIFDGEGGRIDHGAILFAGGKVVQLGVDVQAPPGAVVIDGTGKWLTPGIIDVHSHMGGFPSPDAGVDGLNELTNPVTSEVFSGHSIWPNDPAFLRALTNGGVTTLQILPGSGNLFGGRSVTIKNVNARTMQGMEFPGAPYGLKMACGENPLRVYGEKGRMPSTRMGVLALDRATWQKALDYKRRWDKWVRDGGEPPPRDLQLDTLAAVLAGKILVHTHCYRSDDMANFIDMSKEFGYHVTAFHHAVEAYKIPDLLKENNICAVVFADQFGMKPEALDGVPEAIPLLWKAGVCVMIHSDNPLIGQVLNQEVAKTLGAGRRIGIDVPEATAWEFLSYNPAKALGIADQTGSLKPGKMADVVLWNGDPFSAYSRPEKVWIDGALLYDMHNPKLRPISDFELGQPGEGDVK